MRKAESHHQSNSPHRPRATERKARCTELTGIAVAHGTPRRALAPTGRGAAAECAESTGTAGKGGRGSCGRLQSVEKAGGPGLPKILLWAGANARLRGLWDVSCCVERRVRRQSKREREEVTSSLGLGFCGSQAWRALAQAEQLAALV